MTGTKCFKVVQENDGELRSSLSHGVYTVVYKPSEEVEARVGGLLVFTSYENARRYAPYLGEHQIWEAEGFDKVTLPPRRAKVAWGRNLDADSYERAWKGDSSISDGHLKWPRGTKAFKRVKLVKKVDSQGACK